jgi:hypothetical protein
VAATWRSGWRSGWRGVEIDIRSPLPISEARTRLRAAVKSRWDLSGFDGRQVVGRVRDDDTVRLQARTAMVRNSWRPVARCGLRLDGLGCRLTGKLRAPVSVLVFSAVWLGLACVFALISLAAMLATLATGHWHDAGPATAAVAAVGIAFVVFGAGLINVGFAAGRKDGDFLLAWLAERLESTAPDER